jgi:Tfp pilus assembly protein PilN
MKLLVIGTMAMASLASTAALAQTLPLQSRSERQVDRINNGLMQQEQQLMQDQQRQFNANEARQQRQSNAMMHGIAPIGRSFGRR